MFIPTYFTYFNQDFSCSIVHGCCGLMFILHCTFSTGDRSGFKHMYEATLLKHVQNEAWHCPVTFNSGFTPLASTSPCIFSQYYVL